MNSQIVTSALSSYTSKIKMSCQTVYERQITQKSKKSEESPERNDVETRETLGNRKDAYIWLALLVV